jgi:hypothetical protein
LGIRVFYTFDNIGFLALAFEQQQILTNPDLLNRMLGGKIIQII